MNRSKSISIYDKFESIELQKNSTSFDSLWLFVMRWSIILTADATLDGELKSKVSCFKNDKTLETSFEVLTGN